MQIIAATGNKNKLEELTSAASLFSHKIVAPRNFLAGDFLSGDVAVTNTVKRPSEVPHVEETGLTYRANALLKAETFLQWSGIPALGDDSGLEVAALGGRPGLYSARYGGAGLSDRERVQLLLSELREHEQQSGRCDRRAWFCCSLALCMPGGEIFFGDYRMEGTVLDEPRGAGGFGYDPIIFLPAIGATLAEVDFSVTCAQGFRAHAAQELFTRVARAYKN